jgi:hypothetical protein
MRSHLQAAAPNHKVVHLYAHTCVHVLRKNNAAIREEVVRAMALTFGKLASLSQATTPWGHCTVSVAARHASYSFGVWAGARSPRRVLRPCLITISTMVRGAVSGERPVRKHHPPSLTVYLRVLFAQTTRHRLVRQRYLHVIPLTGHSSLDIPSKTSGLNMIPFDITIIEDSRKAGSPNNRTRNSISLSPYLYPRRHLYSSGGTNPLGPPAP